MSMAELTPNQQQELQRLMSGGLLHPKKLIEAAQRPSSAFHNSFEWDDTKAANLYRMEQARNLIQTFTIYNEELKINVRAFSSLQVDRENGGGYRLTMDAMAAPSLRAELIRTALKDFEALRVRYSYLTELAGIFEAIELKQAETEPAPAAKKQVRAPRAKKEPKVQTRFGGALA